MGSRNRTAIDSPIRRITRRVEQFFKFLLANPLGALVRPNKRGMPVDLTEISSVLILRYDAVGDAVLSTPVWRAIKQAAPHIHIGVAGSVRNRQLLEADPHIDEVLLFSKKFSIDLLRNILRARKTKWDMALNLFFHDKTRAAIYSKLAAPHGTSVTIVREKREKYERLYSLVGDRPPLKPPTPMVLQNLLVLEVATGIHLLPEESAPALHIDPTLERSITAIVQQLLADHGAKGYVLLNTDAAESFREWGYERDFAFSQRIVRQRPDLLMVWTSSPLRAPLAKEFLEGQMELAANILYLDTPSLHYLTMAVRLSELVVSPDTSVIHFAAAENKPVVGLYIEPNEFLPYAAESRVVFAPDGRTIASIGVDAVLDLTLELLDLLAVDSKSESTGTSPAPASLS